MCGGGGNNNNNIIGRQLLTSTQNPLVLTYFQLQGRGEPIRLALEVFGIPYVNNYNFTTEEYKQYSFGKVPHLQHNNFEVVELNAILLYLQRFSPSHSSLSLFSQSQIEQYLSGLEDIRKIVSEWVYHSSPSPQLRLSYQEKLLSSLSYIENILLRNGGFYGKGILPSPSHSLPSSPSLLPHSSRAERNVEAFHNHRHHHHQNDHDAC